MISPGPSVLKLANFVNGNPFKPADLGDEGLPVIRIRQLLDSTAATERAIPPDRPVTIERGDLIFSWSATLAVRHWYGGRALLNQHLFRVDPVPGVDGRWLGYALEVGVEYLRPLMHGSAMTHITLDMLRSLTVSVPEISPQRAIADYLDIETGRIDALISKKRRMIEVLAERYLSSVTDRINNSVSKMVQLRRVLTSLVDGPFGSSLTSAHYVDEGARVVRLGNIGVGEFLDADRAYISTDYYRVLHRHRVEEGDLLIAGLGDATNHVGRACVAPDLGSAIVKADCYRAQVNAHLASAHYLALFLSSPTGAMSVGAAGRGTTRTRINLELAKAIRVPLPALVDQESLVETARTARSRLRGLTTALDQQCQLLEERRWALVTAAVTGELVVPGVLA